MHTPIAQSASRLLQRAWLTRGPLAWALLPLAAIYGLLIGGRRFLYRIHLMPTDRLEVPVVVVGNLIVGGAGKTPAVIALVALLRRLGFTPGILSRGYGGGGYGNTVDVRAETPVSVCGDEPKLLHQRTSAPVMVGRKRAGAGRAMLQLHPEVDVIVCDDGLQHHALVRDVQIAVFDDRGVGNGWLLPAGPLREPLTVDPPPCTLVVYNSAAPSTHWAGSLGTRRFSGVIELNEWRRGIRPSTGAVDLLRGRPLFAVAGIAQPERFFSMLRELGLFIDTLALPDHFPFDNLPWPAHTRDVVITEKDAVKIDLARTGETRVWVAALDFDLGPEFESDLIKLLPARRARPR